MSNQFDILIIEDDPVIVNATGKVLRREGFKIDEALGAESALSKLQVNNYKIIVSDLMLPRTSGIEIIEKVQQTNPEIPIIIMTGYAVVENAVKCFKTGAFDVIPKPFDIDELLGVVYRAMRHAELMPGVSAIANHIQLQHEESTGFIGKGKFYFLGQHSWANIDPDGLTKIGPGETFPARMGDIRSIEFPTLNAFLWQGNICLKIIANKHLVHTIWSPLSGKVIEINSNIEKNSKLININPIHDSWLIKIMPTNLANELENLSLRKY